MSNKLTKEEFIQKAKDVHGDTYDYSLVEYKGNRLNIKIICPNHGKFNQTPGNHLAGRGCRRCSSNKRIIKTKNEFIQKAKKVHGNKYNYNL